jgi:GNAT superfamily N-acetyltransferase
MNPVDLQCANLTAALKFYGTPEEREGVLTITSATSYSVFNIAILTRPAKEGVDELRDRIEAARRHFERVGHRWSFWVCEDWLSGRAQRKHESVFDSFDMTCLTNSPGMEIGDLGPPGRRLPEIAVRPVGDRATRSDFTGIVSQCFHVPGGVAEQVYMPEPVWHGDLKAWVGYKDGLAVTVAATVCAAGALGVYSVATLPAWRRRGYAEAVMRAAVIQARRECAGGPIVLQSSAFGLKLYRKLGFKRTTRFFVYATE